MIAFSYLREILDFPICHLPQIRDLVIFDSEFLLLKYLCLEYLPDQVTHSGMKYSSLESPSLMIVEVMSRLAKANLPDLDFEY